MTVDAHDRGRFEPGRSGAGRFMRTLEGAERDAEACRLKARGWTYGRIAEELEYANESGARKAVKRTLDKAPAEAAEELRAVMQMQLEYLYSRVMEALERKHLTVSQGGKVVVHNGEELLDDGPIFQGADRAVRILERISKLMRVDIQPERGEISDEDLDAAYAKLLEQFGDDEPAGPPEEDLDDQGVAPSST